MLCYAHANKFAQLINMQSFCFGDASFGSQGETGDWHSLVSTSVTPPAACEVGTEQQSEALGNICGQLHGEEGGKARNLLLINKIMGAIRPFSHHHRLQSLPHFIPFLSFSFYASHSLSHFFYKKLRSLFKNGLKDWGSVRERKEDWGGRGWGSDLQTNN